MPSHGIRLKNIQGAPMPCLAMNWVLMYGIKNAMHRHTAKINDVKPANGRYCEGVKHLHAITDEQMINVDQKPKEAGQNRDHVATKELQQQLLAH